MIQLTPNNKFMGCDLANYTLTAVDEDNHPLTFFDIDGASFGNSVTVNNQGFLYTSYVLKFNGHEVDYAIVTASLSGHPTYTWTIKATQEEDIGNGHLVNDDGETVWSANSNRNYKLNYNDLSNKPVIYLWAEQAVTDVSVGTTTFGYTVGEWIKSVGLVPSADLNPLCTIKAARVGQEFAVRNLGPFVIRVRGDLSPTDVVVLKPGDSVQMASDADGKTYTVNRKTNLLEVNGLVILNNDYVKKFQKGEPFFIIAPYVEGSAQLPYLSWTDDASVVTTIKLTYGRLYVGVRTSDNDAATPRWAITGYANLYQNDPDTMNEVISDDLDLTVTSTESQRVADRHALGTMFYIRNSDSESHDVKFFRPGSGNLPSTVSVASESLMMMVKVSDSTNAGDCRYAAMG